MQLRLLPVLVLTLLLLFSTKIAGIVEGTQDVLHVLLLDNLEAQPAEAASSEEPQTEQDTPSDPTDSENLEPKGHGGDDAAKDTHEAPPKEASEEQAQPSFSPEQIDILTQLSQRREALEKQEQNMMLREVTLKAAEERLHQKLTELQALHDKTQAILALYNQKEDEKITRLVKIYEKMKPKDAAKIFEKMELGILLEVVSTMKESRIAPILAEMTPLSAKELTLALAKYRRLPNVSPQFGQ